MKIMSKFKASIRSTWRQFAWFALYLVGLYTFFFVHLPAAIAVIIFLASLISLFMFFRSRDSIKVRHLNQIKLKPTYVYAVSYRHDPQFIMMFGTAEAATRYCNLMNEVYVNNPYHHSTLPVIWR